MTAEQRKILEDLGYFNGPTVEAVKAIFENTDQPEDMPTMVVIGQPPVLDAENPSTDRPFVQIIVPRIVANRHSELLAAVYAAMDSELRDVVAKEALDPFSAEQ